MKRHMFTSKTKKAFFTLLVNIRRFISLLIYFLSPQLTAPGSPRLGFLKVPSTKFKKQQMIYGRHDFCSPHPPQFVTDLQPKRLFTITCVISVIFTHDISLDDLPFFRQNGLIQKHLDV